jgi:hypothetical protein
MTLAPMSASGIARVVLFWGPLGCASLVLANEEVLPDIEFLEYMGSWDASDEDWLLFSDETDQIVVVDDSKQSDTAENAEESTELRDES